MVKKFARELKNRYIKWKRSYILRPFFMQIKVEKWHYSLLVFSHKSGVIVPKLKILKAINKRKNTSSQVVSNGNFPFIWSI